MQSKLLCRSNIFKALQEKLEFLALVENDPIRSMKIKYMMIGVDFFRELLICENSEEIKLLLELNPNLFE